MSDRDAFLRFKELSPDSRERVSSALKEAVEREVQSIGGGNVAAGNIFSRGWVFSRLTPTAVLDEVILTADLARELPGAAGLSEEDFVGFAERLSAARRNLNPAEGSRARVIEDQG